ncbi:putative quinol monooxygenase [Methylobacterium nonmethylotrophicum]|uniref:Antibiotic biosynthesis monooxygenase n=1 Tax=Methylobacterium nonmethylotrophicum TaxID=1141884 RepID=A0A4Z0NR73_9HYPH|nr:antibiotic biosynthesis monooxygenase [Methylobacterium nonmethylotrophicum]TGD99641.1 antibiotic biosynthesis monooxygenase [Methylobacterium nonmethylotrophicum]
MLIVTGYVLVAPSDAAAFVAGMAAFARTARARDGCLFFAVAPDGIEEGRMLVIERWREQAALDAHLAAGDTVAFVERWQGRMTGDVAKFDAANERALLDP